MRAAAELEEDDEEAPARPTPPPPWKAPEVIRGIDVQRFRALLGISQPVLAKWLHVSLRTIQNWEQASTDPVKMNAGQTYFFRLALEAAEEDHVPEEIGECLAQHDPDRAWLCVLETGRRDRRKGP